MKPYIKGLKLFSFLFVIIASTFLVIRKKDKLSINIEERVKNSLEVNKNYLAINNSPIRKLNKIDKHKLSLISNLKTTDSTNIYTLDHRCRINDTLFSVQVFLDKENNITDLGKPKKVYYR